MYVAGSMLLYLAFSVVSEGLNLLLFGRHHTLFFPLDPGVLKAALSYSAIQAPFLLGAVYFRKHALSKTVLCFLALSLLFGLGVLVAVWILFGGRWVGMDFEALFAGTDFSAAWIQLANVGRMAAGIGKVIFWLVIPIVCWTICFFRLKETER